MIKLDTLTCQLGQIHEDLNFTNERVNSMEVLLNVYSTTPKQAAAMNAHPSEEKMDDDENLCTPGIDTSDSIVLTHQCDIITLKEENLHLKRNLQENVDKLNEALRAVSNMQQMMISAGQLHESRKITIGVLDKPKDFIPVPQEELPPHPSFL